MTNLSDEVKRVLELDAAHRQPITTTFKPIHQARAELDFHKEAPTMANIIRQQQALLVEAREALDYAWERVYINKDGVDCLKQPFDLQTIIETLTRLQAATME